MGKATIISGGADGLYTIQIDAGSQQQASRLEKIEASLASVLERIPEAQSEYLAATTRETYAAGALNAAIESYAAAVAQNPETASTANVDRLTGEYYTAARFAGEARTRLQDLTLQQRQLESDKAATTSAPVSETRQAWCVDLTEDAAGEVATIEVPGEPGTVLVAPGGRAPSAGDGALVARELMTPEQAFFNAAILPGWQKWMPTFRTGTITAINSDNDTADVSLDDATSSAQSLGVNQTSSLSDVPVDYMECNAAAFEVGDPCVVRFDGQRWDSPRVVGFAREPKGCQYALLSPVYISGRNRVWVFVFPAPESEFTMSDALTLALNHNLTVSYKIGNGEKRTCYEDLIEGVDTGRMIYFDDYFYIIFLNEEYGYDRKVCFIYLNAVSELNAHIGKSTRVEISTKDGRIVMAFTFSVCSNLKISMKPVRYAGTAGLASNITPHIYEPRTSCDLYQ
ncbi:MAG: hypothetical protein ACMV1D_05320 [Macromonas sp.]